MRTQIVTARSSRSRLSRRSGDSPVRNQRDQAAVNRGDAGWGDPAHEFGALPIEALPHVVAGYEAAGGELAGSEATIVWNQIGRAVDEVESGYRADAITAVLAFARDAEPRWRFK